MHGADVHGVLLRMEVVVHWGMVYGAYFTLAM